MTFKELGINEEWVESIRYHGIKNPTAIQTSVIPHVLAGADVLAQSPTGTGKTLSFLLPLFQMLGTHKKNPAMLILVPTRELCIQVYDEACKLAEGHHHEVVAIYGGQESQKQLKKLNKGADVIVATPGRLMDFIAQGAISLKEVHFLVLDEVDQMLLLGFRNEMDELLKIMPSNKQTLCFSATVDSKVKKLAYRTMKNPVEIEESSDESDYSHIIQGTVMTSDRWKTEALLDALNKTNPFLAIIFCRTIRRAEKLEGEMKRRKYNCAILHGDMSQSARARIVKQFREADIQYLITTDLASRGLDFSGITHIFNLDMPETIEGYTHRIGRTGRMGAEGKAVSMITSNELPMVEALEKALRIEIIRDKYERPDDFIDTTHNRS